MCMLTQISLPESQKKELPRKDSHLPTQREATAAVSAQADCFTQRNSLFNKEVLQVKCHMLSKLKPVLNGMLHKFLNLRCFSP